jgi:hypothetical protein
VFYLEDDPCGLKYVALINTKNLFVLTVLAYVFIIDFNATLQSMPRPPNNLGELSDPLHKHNKCESYNNCLTGHTASNQEVCNGSHMKGKKPEIQNFFKTASLTSRRMAVKMDCV